MILSLGACIAFNSKQPGYNFYDDCFLYLVWLLSICHWISGILHFVDKIDMHNENHSVRC